jgi:glycerol-3-phosphate acyltransferase PlsX
MGGDHAPTEVVRGAALFVRKTSETDTAARVTLVGDSARIEAELAAIEEPFARERLSVVHTDEVVAMDEHPTEAFQKKRGSSLVRTVELVKLGEAQAAFSAGNTGAMLVSSMMLLEKTPGIARPAIATLMPTEKGGRTVLVDAGANVDARSRHMVHFALLGSVYAERALGISKPRVGLLSNGEEQAKGNELTKESWALLSDQPGINFVGNVEGNHVFEGHVDVVVCDGFVGNVLLKGAEGCFKLVLSSLAAEVEKATDEATRNALLAALLLLRKRIDYSEFGGAPLLGVNGVSFIAHGRSDQRAIANGIQAAAHAARSGYVEAVSDALKELRA